jgi:micrococcal nuclease
MAAAVPVAAAAAPGAVEGLGPARAGAPWRTVARVVDGAVLALDNGERVRLLGIEAPERLAGPLQAAVAGQAGVAPAKVREAGDESAAFARAMVAGQAVRLAYDGPSRDRYGQTLAYVWLEDGRMLNREMARAGYAAAHPSAEFTRRGEFEALEREARRLRRGLHREGRLYTSARAP